MTRRMAREQAFILMFEKSFNPETPMSEIILLAREFRLFEEDEFVRRLVDTALENNELIDGLISANSRGWRIERIPRVSLAILRIALTEIIYFDDVPVGASINEAVELAKTYATPEDASFINGLLGTVARAEDEKK